MRANLHFDCFKLKQQSNTIYWKTDVLESQNACFLIGSSLGCLYKICKVDLTQLLQFPFVCVCVCVCVCVFFLINFISQHVPLQKQYYMLGIAYI